MIATLTLNPSVDVAARVQELVPGTAHRDLETRFDAAGKGINVSLVAQRLGQPTIAFGLIAGETGEFLRSTLEREGVAHGFIQIAGQTRVNLTATDAHGAATRFIGAGPSPGPEALDRLREMLRTWAPSIQLLVLSGSLPPGVPADMYARVTSDARERGVKVLLDAHGRALAAGVAAGPDWIKPNLEEAGELLGQEIRGEDGAVGAARRLVGAGAGSVVLSMGAAGAVFATAGRCLRIRVPHVERKSWVGAGDAMVAGLAVALVQGQSVENALCLGAAAGAASAASQGTAQGSAQLIHALMTRVRIEVLP